MKRYNIICNECKAVRQIAIAKGVNEVVDWLDNNPNPQLVKIISARKRFDDQWGFECICGNNDLWTEQEKKSVKDLVAPQPREIADIVRNLSPVKPKFQMVGV